MNVKLLIVLTIVLSSFILSVNAYQFDIQAGTWHNDTTITLPDDTLYFGFAAWDFIAPQPFKIQYECNFMSEDGGLLYCPYAMGIQTLNYGSSFVPDLGIGTHTITFSGSLNTPQNEPVFKTLKVKYTITENYNPAPDCSLNYEILSIDDNSITYNVYCLPNNEYTYFTEITTDEQTIINNPNLHADETNKVIVLGNNGTNIYSVAVQNINDISGQRRVLSIYLKGRSEIEIIQPTVEPTGAPDDLSQYGEKKNFQIRNIDYLQGTQLNGANLTIYYTDSEDNIISNPIYKNTNSPAVIDLRVPIAGGLFVEYGITPNYEPVKIQNYPYLNNRSGYWITQEISNYENLYYQYYDSDNPLTDINYGITLIDANTHLPVSNAAISIDGGNVQYTSNYGGTVFRNITQGTHTFRVSKNGYNALTLTKNVYITSNIEIEFFPLSVNPTATITPSAVNPTITPSPTISPIDKPTSILESVSYGLAKVFGVKTVDNANYIFALLIILFPAAIAGGITHQALGFIAGGMLGFVFALTIGLIPIWTFFAMCLLAVIYIMLIRGNEGF